MEGRQYHNHDRVVTADVLALRLALAAAGFIPIPLFGKAPPTFGKNNSRKGLSGWQKLGTVTDEMLALWERTWPDAVNTGILTRTTPALDLDILNEEAARAAEDLVRRRFEERGTILVRIGLPPKRAILFRTDTPFAKILVTLVAANGSAEKPEKLEFLGDGQQLAAFGIHPDTGQPYRWHGGEPGQVQREDLPLITDDEARALVAELVELLVRDFGYSRPTKRKRRSGAQTDGGSTTDWADLVSNIRDGQALAVVALQRREPPIPATVDDLIGPRVSPVFNITLDLARRLCLTYCDHWFGQLAIEEIRGTALHCRLKRFNPSNQIAKNVGHFVSRGRFCATQR